MTPASNCIASAQIHVYIDMYSILVNSSVTFQLTGIFVSIMALIRQIGNSLLEFFPILYKITAHLRECVL